MRTTIVGLLCLFGYAAQRVVESERREKDRVLKLNRLLNYIHTVSHHLSARPYDPLQNPVHPHSLPLESVIAEGEVGHIVDAVKGLSQFVDARLEGLYALLELTHEINKGLLVDEVLARMFETFQTVIPYNRIGVALLEAGGKVVTSRWVQSDNSGNPTLPLGYSAPLAGSSLQQILESCQPRIINDLKAYLEENPGSESTKLILKEGILSSLTCPLISMGKPIGFIFFSSRYRGTYRHVHVDIFKLIAGQLSTVLEKSQAYEQLVNEKEKSESLLLNVMPPRIVAQIKAGVQNPVEELPLVGVVFADIVGFTGFTHSCPADAVVGFLHEVFGKYDGLCESFGVEKIKTIGDAYMAFARIQDPSAVELSALARFALAIITTSVPMTCPHGKPLQVRVGLHAGPAIAGVIGQMKFSYDIWGETVNVAQRLESTSLPGQVHVSETVMELLGSKAVFEARGQTELKGEGLMSTYFLLSVHDQEAVSV